MSRPHRRWLLLATSERALARRRTALRHLVDAGDPVVLLHQGPLRLGELDPRVVVREADPVPAGPLLGRGRVRRALARVPRAQAWLDPVLRAAGGADEVLLLDEGAGALLDRLPRAPRGPVHPPSDVDERLRQERHWRVLEDRLAELEQLPSGQNRPRYRVLQAAEALAGRPALTGPTGDHRAVLVDMARHAFWRGEVEEGERLAGAVALLDEHLGPHPDHLLSLRAARAYARTTEQGSLDGAQEDVDALLQRADAALDADDLDLAASFAVDAMRLLFHRELHQARAATPLVEEPATFLRRWRESQVAALLAAPGPDDPPRDRHAPVPPDPSVVLLPGSYPHHATPLRRALDAQTTRLHQVELTNGLLRGMAVDDELVALRLRHALGRATREELLHVRRVVENNPEAPELVDGADLVVADWADKGAVWASMVAPATARLVVRVHSADALAAPLHLVDWHRVDALVFVSQHIQAVFDALAPATARDVPHHVVLNSVDLAPAPDGVEQAGDLSRTMAMVAWGREVKDPRMALEALAILVARDPAWRLRLIGEDFPSPSSPEAEAYQSDVRHRSLAEDLIDHIDYVGQTRRLPEHLAGVGFVLSTSLRESCPVGMLEGMAAGAVPVSREWPAFARHQGAAGLFPAPLVVRTPEEMAEVVWSLREEPDRAAAAREAVDRLGPQVFDVAVADRRLGEILLGRGKG